MTLRERNAFCLLALAALPACTLTDVTIPDSEEVVSVEAVLRTDATVQTVILHRSLNGRDVEGVPGARVTVAAPGGRTITFTEGQAECYRYSSLYFDERPGSIAARCYMSSAGEGAWVHPGTVYRLRVEMPDGRVIQGRTRVPGAFSLSGLPFATRADGRVNALCALPPKTLLPVAWTRSDSASGYVAPLRIFDLRDALAAQGVEVEIPNPLELNGIAVTGSDTTILLPAEFGVFERFEYESEALTTLQTGFPDLVLAELVVAAIDRNYLNGVRGGTFNPSGQVRVSSVSGDGVGVFGSITPLYLRIRVMTEVSARRIRLPLCSAWPRQALVSR